MAVHPVLTWPDPVLSQVSASVALDEDVSGLISDLFDTLYAAQGRGLAAPQIGVLKRIFVMDEGWKEGRPEPKAFINPLILSAGTERVSMIEGCLSIPGVDTPVERFVTVQVGAERGLPGARHCMPFPLSGIAARIAQHEIDHLDGVITLDRVDVETRNALLTEIPI